jgi:hypothetical protein
MATTPTDINIAVLCDNLGRDLKARKNGKILYRAVVNVPFDYKLEMAWLFLGFIVFYLVNETKQNIYVAAASDNEYYHHSVDNYAFKLKDYILSLDNTENSIVQAIIMSKPVGTTNWDNLRRPRVDPGIARSNQASGGIGYSEVFPLTGKARGGLMYSYFQEYDAIGKQQKAFMQTYTQLVSRLLDDN